MPNIQWPLKFLAPRRCLPLASNITGSGGRSLTSKEIITAADAGFWTIKYTELPLASVTGKRAWRAISGRARGRKNIIDVPIYDTDTAPWPLINGKPVYEYIGIPHSDTALFSDGSGYSQEVITGDLYADFPIGAIQTQLQMTNASELQAGMHFSMEGQSGKNRLFRIRSIEAVSIVGGFPVYTVKVWPPNREDFGAGTALRFAFPLCSCKLMTDREMETGIDDYAGRTLAGVNFVESLP